MWKACVLKTIFLWKGAGSVKKYISGGIKNIKGHTRSVDNRLSPKSPPIANDQSTAIHIIGIETR
jgi:hypothetical protein